MWTDRWMDRKTYKKSTNGQTNGQTNRWNYTNLERKLAMMLIYVPMNSIGQTIFELESGNENVNKQTDGQTNGQKTEK